MKGENMKQRVETIDFVLPNLALGGARVMEWQLKDAGVTHYLTVCYGDPEWTSLVGFYNPMQDDGQDMPDKYWQKTIDIGLEVLSNPENKLYVHCYKGIARGPAACYAIMRGLGYGKLEAAEMIRSARPKVALYHYSPQVDEMFDRKTINKLFGS